MLKCNCCGEPIKKAVDIEPVLEIKHNFGYSSKRDLEKLHVIFCPTCTEDLTQHLISKCVISPIIKNCFVI